MERNLNRPGVVIGMGLGLLMLPLLPQQAAARSRRATVKKLMQATWKGTGKTRSADFAMTLRFLDRARKASVTIQWSKRGKLGRFAMKNRQVRVRSGCLTAALRREGRATRASCQRIQVKLDHHTPLGFGSSSLLLCRLLSRRVQQRLFKCKFGLSTWLALRQPAAKLPNNPLARCWLDTHHRPREGRRVKALRLNADGSYRWEKDQGYWRKWRGTIYLLNRQRSAGTKWSYKLKPTGRTARLTLTKPESFKYLGRGRYIYFRFRSPHTTYRFRSYGAPSRCTQRPVGRS